MSREAPARGRAPSRHRSEIRDALGCITSAPGGKLPIAELQLLLGWDGNRANDLLLDAGVFLEQADDPLGGPSVSIAHTFVREWLTSPEANMYRCDPHSAFRFMGEYYYKIASEDAAGLTEWEAAHILGVLESAGMLYELATLWSDGGIAERCLNAAIALREGNALAGAQDALRPLGRFVRESPECDDDLKARILNEHANQLRLVGRIGEAMAAYEGALGLRRGLAEADAAFLSNYADSLNNYGCILQEVGRNDDAERMLREALSIYRGLAHEEPDAYAPGVAKVLGNLGVFLCQTNRSFVAEEEYRESIETFLRCADEDASCMRHAAHMLGLCETKLAAHLATLSCLLENNVLLLTQDAGKGGERKGVYQHVTCGIRVLVFLLGELPRAGGFPPALFLRIGAFALSELSIHVDESGDMGTVSKYYLITLVFHDQGDSLTRRIESYEQVLRQRSLPNTVFHLSPLINAHGDYLRMSVADRRQLLSTFRLFTDHLPFRYHTLAYKKSEYASSDALLARMKRDLVLFLFDNLAYFQSFDVIKVYYDNGQPLVTIALHQAIDYALAKDAVIYRDASPVAYRLMQVADYACGIELTAIRLY